MLLSTDAQIRQLSTNEILTLDESRLTVRSRDLIPSVRTLFGDNWRTANDSSKRQRPRDRLGRVDSRLEGPASERTTVSTRFREELWDPQGNDPVWEVGVDSREPLASGPPPEPSPRRHCKSAPQPERVAVDHPNSSCTQRVWPRSQAFRTHVIHGDWHRVTGAAGSRRTPPESRLSPSRSSQTTSRILRYLWQAANSRWTSAW